MRRITGKHLLCFLLLVLPLSWAEDTKGDAKKTGKNSGRSQAKNTVFPRRKAAQDKPKARATYGAVVPARRCGRLMESCSSRVLCCDPCASCRCRLFNTICHCWRMNHTCQKRT